MATVRTFASWLLSAIVMIQLVSSIRAGAIMDDVPYPRSQEPFSFEDIFDSAYRVRTFSGQWIDGVDDFLYRDSNSGALLRFFAANKSTTVYIENATFTDNNIDVYYTSNDLQYVLFAYERVALWRHSFSAKYKVFEVATGSVHEFPSVPLSGSVLQYAGWNSAKNDFTFVYGNNLYYQASVNSPPQQLTTSGDQTWIYNGVPDWLYEEDVLGDRVSHYSSPDGRYIVYAELNDTGVPLQAWPLYGSKDDVFGQTIQIPYPKAGDIRDGKPGPNTRVTLYVVDTESPSMPKVLQPVADLVNQDHYYLQVAWCNNTRVMVVWANRVQNKSWSAIYDVTESNPVPVVNYQYSVTGGWVEVPPATPWFIDNGARYLTVAPDDSGNSGAWRHLALVTAPTDGAGSVKFLSHGEEEVDYIVGYDAASNSVYYISTNGDPSERHLFVVEVDGGTPQCLTCSQPDTCRYVTAGFSTTYLYYILGCRGPEIPVFTLKNRVNDSDYYVLEDNSVLSANLASKQWPTREFINFTIGGGYTGRAEIFIPPNPAPGEKFPLLVYAYAGPGSQRVMKTFPMGGSTNNWLLYLKSTHRIAVASLDGRGSMAAGDKLKFEMYKKLSVVEIEDQNKGGEEFRKLSYIDTSLPLGIFGWSYGGGVAAHLIGDSSDVFTCGISVAPVTTKAFYDTAYTERYLGFATADDGAAGYDATDVMNKVENFMNKSFLIAHGTADDNVHFMHAAHLVRALSDAGVQFRQNMYVDQNHGISASGQSRHLYATLTNFLLNDCWSKQQSQTPEVTTVTTIGAGSHINGSWMFIFCLSALAVIRRLVIW